MKNLKSYAIVAAICIVALTVSWFAGRCTAGTPEPVTVTEQVVIDRPVPKQTIIERVTTVRVPVEVTRTVTEIDTLVVREFIEAAQDSLADPVHLPYSFEYDGKKLLLWGTMSDGSRTFNGYDARPKFTGGWDADSTWLREDRTARFPKWKVAGGVVVAGVVACVVLC